jgi:preprotein translocase subunit SecG
MASILLNIQIVVSILLIVIVLLQNKNVSLNLTSMGG